MMDSSVVLTIASLLDRYDLNEIYDNPFDFLILISSYHNI